MSGWFAVNRKLFEHPMFYRQPERVAVFVWMMGRAAYKPTPFDANGKRFVLQRGQLCATQREIAEQTGVGRQVVRSLLNDLQATQTITQDRTHPSTQAKTVITLCNYDKYQSALKDCNPEPNQQPTTSQPTKEQGNKINNSSPNGEDADASGLVSISVVTSAVWHSGKQYLRSMGVNNPGSMIGRWLKSHPPLVILTAIEAAQKAGTQDPIPYITEVLKGAEDGRIGKNGHGASGGRENRIDPAIENIARLAGLG